MVDGLHHAALAVSDIPRAVAFFEDVLGFSPVGPDDETNTIDTATYFWMDIGGGEWLNLSHRPDALPAYPGQQDDPHLAFESTAAAIETVERRLAERGVETETSATSLYFHDPDGDFLELTEWVGPER